MIKTIDEILQKISLKYNLKFSYKNSNYQLESSIFFIKLKLDGDKLSYWINHRYGLISYLFTKSKIEKIIIDLKTLTSENRITLNQVVLNK